MGMSERASPGPFVDEFELHGLLFLHGGQQLLQVVALLCDVAVLHLLLLTAVTADQLRPLFSVLRCDVLYLPHTHTHTESSTAEGLTVLLAADRSAVRMLQRYLGFVVGDQRLDLILRLLLQLLAVVFPARRHDACM